LWEGIDGRHYQLEQIPLQRNILATYQQGNIAAAKDLIPHFFHGFDPEQTTT
jgi:hypothetical protein